MADRTIAKLGRTLQYVGAGLAAWRLRSADEVVRDKAGRHLQERLGRLRGLPQKVGQMLSMSDNDGAAAFVPLQGTVPAMDLARLLPIVEDAWGRDPYEVCATIDEEGLAASLGQVHRAVLHDGRTVAIKIQYAGMREAVATDLDALGWLAKPVGNLRRGFDLDAYRSALRASLEEELDYRTEAANQADMARACRSLDVVVPEVVPELSGEHVLTTVWEEGETLDEVHAWDPDARLLLATRLLEQFFVLALDRGVLHADPHPGNYRFRMTPNGPVVVLYDYGCVHRIEERERLVLLKLLAEGMDPSGCTDPLPLFVELGFDAELLRPLRHKLPALCRVLFEPFASKCKYDLSSWNRGERVGDILGEDRLNFRIAGPTGLLFFLRAFQGLVYYVGELAEPVLWSRPLPALLVTYGEAVSRLELQEPPVAAQQGLAEHLCIKVTQDGRPKARVTLPARVVERLDELIDGALHDKIQERGIDLKELIREVRRNQYAPQPIFSLTDGTKLYEVWLE